MALTLRRLQKVSGAEDLSHEDATTILRLDRRCFPEDKPPTLRPCVWWLAYDGRKPVGYAGILDGGDGVFELVRVGVVKSHQGKGLGRRLLKARLDWAQKQHPDPRVITYASAHNYQSLNNLIAQGFRVYDKKDGLPRFVYMHWRPSH